MAIPTFRPVHKRIANEIAIENPIIVVGTGTFTALIATNATITTGTSTNHQVDSLTVTAGTSTKHTVTSATITAGTSTKHTITSATITAGTSTKHQVDSATITVGTATIIGLDGTTTTPLLRLVGSGVGGAVIPGNVYATGTDKGGLLTVTLDGVRRYIQLFTGSSV